MRTAPGPIIGFRVPSNHAKRALVDQAHREDKTLSDLMREFVFDGLERKQRQQREASGTR